MNHVLIWLATGMGVGWLARNALGSHREYGLLGDLTTGCLGAVVGGWLMRESHVFAPDNLLGHGFTAMVGAVTLLIVIRGLRLVLPAGFTPPGTAGSTAPDLETRIRLSTEFERGVLARFLSRKSSVADPNKIFHTQLTIGERIADKVASFGGSWTFIGLFFIAMFCWMAVNEELTRPLDPFPFILLNLMLSCLAAIQAPIIMMSQNRHAAKDRVDARNDYEVNLRAEMEIMALHAKLDAAREDELARIVRQLDAQVAQLARLEAQLGREPGG